MNPTVNESTYINHHFPERDDRNNYIKRCMNTKGIGMSRQKAFAICMQEYTYKIQSKEKTR